MCDPQHVLGMLHNPIYWKAKITNIVVLGCRMSYEWEIRGNKPSNHSLHLCSKYREDEMSTSNQFLRFFFIFGKKWTLYCLKNSHAMKLTRIHAYIAPMVTINKTAKSSWCHVLPRKSASVQSGCSRQESNRRGLRAFLESVSAPYQICRSATGTLDLLMTYLVREDQESQRISRIATSGSGIWGIDSSPPHKLLPLKPGSTAIP